MKKTGIMTDSHSGILENEASKLGIAVLPMPFYIDEKLYREGVDISREEFYEMLRKGADVATSQPSPESVMHMWSAMLQEYEELVYIPISSGLYITGDKPDRERFQKFAEALPMAIGNPMYHWTNLELHTFFGYDGVLNGDTAEEVWNLCNDKLQHDPKLTVRGLIEQSNVAFIGTTDDPIDSLECASRSCSCWTVRMSTPQMSTSVRM